MELDAAKMIGAGLAVIALFGVGIGIGNIFSTLISTVGRNPSVQQRVFPFAIIGFAWLVSVKRVEERVADVDPGFDVPTWPGIVIVTLSFALILIIALGWTDRIRWSRTSIPSTPHRVSTCAPHARAPYA